MSPTCHLREQLAVEPGLRRGEFVSTVCPGAYGNIGGMAYGGCTAAVATSAAFATVPAGYFLYSLVGHFLGPATTTAPLHCAVHTTRATRTFATRRVVVTQAQPGGRPPRACLELVADFHVVEPALLTYAAPPALVYRGGPAAAKPLAQLVAEARAAGLVTDDPVARLAPMFYAQLADWEMRTCTEGMAGQNLVGMLARQVPTDQDALHVTERVSADWMRLRAPLASVADKTAALVFLMDGGVPFVALQHSKLWYTESGPCNSLDFALRLFAPVVDLKDWHLRERKTIAAGYGRAYNESRLFDEQGGLVASMTQQCILRPKSEPTTKASL